MDTEANLKYKKYRIKTARTITRTSKAVRVEETTRNKITKIIFLMFKNVNLKKNEVEFNLSFQ